jgi:hypothetical protein
MKDTWVKKGLVVSVTLLFIGVAIAPSINFNIVKASNDNDLVEVTSQACGIQGFGDTTVKLTKEQYQNLEQYLVEFRERLNQTSTREEAVPIFKEAVVELNKYGLLPRGMRVDQAQHLVTSWYQGLKMIQRIGAVFKKKTSDNFTNSFCLLSGFSNNTQIFSLLLNCWVLLCDPIKDFILHLPFLDQMRCLLAWYFLALGIIAFDYLRPVMLWSTIYIMGGGGFLLTLGLNGMKKLEGYQDVNGKITGFTGIKILLNLKIPLEDFYIGSALKVQMSYV